MDERCGKRPQPPVDPSPPVVDGASLLRVAALESLGIGRDRSALITRDGAEVRLVVLSAFASTTDWSHGRGSPRLDKATRALRALPCG